MIRPAIRALALASLALIPAGCSSLVPETQKQLEAVDPVQQDIAGMVLTLDLPAAVQPVADSTQMSVVFRLKGQPERRVDAKLVLADPGTLTDTLPPPTAGRAYYFMAFSPEDQATLRETQKWARSAGASASGGLSMAPRFCGTAPLDATKAKFSVNVTLPGITRSAPLVRDEVLANALALSNQTALQPC